MLPAKHVILRRVETRRTRGRAGHEGVEYESVQSGAPIAVEVDALTARRAEEVSRHRDVEAVAPAIPMKLIAPVNLPGAASPASTSPASMSPASTSPASMSTAWGIQAVGADRSPFSGDGVRVAVLDTGIDASHPAFDGVELVQRNFTSESDEDLDGHGTHCAGTIFGHDISGKRIGCGSSGGTSRGLWDDVLGVAGLVDAVTFLGEVVVPVVVEVAVAADGAEFEDGLCTG